MTAWFDDMPPWNRFIWTWGKVCDALRNEQMYQEHLAEIAPGTPLAAACARVMHGNASAQDLIDFARWELWEAMMSLDPWVPRDRGIKPHLAPAGRPLPRIQDGFHASCCASRAEGALRRLERILEEGLPTLPPTRVQEGQGSGQGESVDPHPEPDVKPK